MDEQATNKQLDLLLAERALHQLVGAYSHAADQADEAALATLFHPDAHVDSGVITGNAGDFCRDFVQWCHDHVETTVHAVSGSTFDIRGDVATGESYVIAICQFNEANGGTKTVTGGRYFDAFSKVDGQWKFSTRRFVADTNFEV